MKQILYVSPLAIMPASDRFTYFVKKRLLFQDCFLRNFTVYRTNIDSLLTIALAHRKSIFQQISDSLTNNELAFCYKIFNRLIYSGFKGVIEKTLEIIIHNNEQQSIDLQEKSIDFWLNGKRITERDLHIKGIKGIKSI